MVTLNRNSLIEGYIDNRYTLIKRQKIELTKKQLFFSDEEQNIRRYITYLQTAPAAIEGEGGDITTFKTACRGRDFALSEMKTFELMSEYWNTRCQPEWELENLKKKVHNAYTYNVDNVGKRTAENDFAKFSNSDEDDICENAEKLIWDIDKNNAIKPTLRNVVNYLLCKDYPFLGILKYNESCCKIFTIRQTLRWGMWRQISR